MTGNEQRRPGGGDAANDQPLEHLHHSKPSCRGNRPLVTRELLEILEATLALRRNSSRRRDNGGWEARP
jgi:hypothetical protein